MLTTMTCKLTVKSCYKPWVGKIKFFTGLHSAIEEKKKPPWSAERNEITQNDSCNHQNVIYSVQLLLKMCETAVYVYHVGVRPTGSHWKSRLLQEDVSGQLCVGGSPVEASAAFELGTLGNFASSQLTVFKLETEFWLLTHLMGIRPSSNTVSLIHPQVHRLHIWFKYLIFKFEFYWHILVLYLYHHAIKLLKWTAARKHKYLQTSCLNEEKISTAEIMKLCSVSNHACSFTLANYTELNCKCIIIDLLSLLP